MPCVYSVEPADCDLMGVVRFLEGRNVRVGMIDRHNRELYTKGVTEEITNELYQSMGVSIARISGSGD